MNDSGSADGVRELRLVVTDRRLRRGAALLPRRAGLPEEAAFSGEGGRVASSTRAGRRWSWPTRTRRLRRRGRGRPPVAGHVRVAFEVDDAEAAHARLEAAGAAVIAEPTRTPWDSLNARLEAPAGLQLTLFQELA